MTKGFLRTGDGFKASILCNGRKTLLIDEIDHAACTFPVLMFQVFSAMRANIVIYEEDTTNHLKRILAASDMSAPARHAVERAALVSKDTASALELLHVADLAPLERLRQLMGATPADMEQRVLDVDGRNSVTSGRHSSSASVSRLPPM